MPPKHSSKPPPGHVCDLTASRGVSIYYETSGPTDSKWQGEKEEVLLLLLGSVADLRKTADQQYIHQCVTKFKVLTYDHRNTGQSTRKDEPCTMEDYADDAAALLETVLPGRSPVFVLGVSFGGMVAQHLAIRHPHLIKKLSLCCCSTGGEGGASFPIQNWYEPTVTVEERVWQRMSLANSDRNEKWKEEDKSMYQMVTAVLTRDEACGVDEPLFKEGIARQLEARRNHNVWDKIGELSMDVLCCGSSKDQLCPPELTQRMAERIKKCTTKLDFDWGHPFIAADVNAMPYVNEWFRSTTVTSTWKVVGGKENGGIIVRTGAELASAQADARLSTNALVSEIALVDGRLHYKLLEGTGPSEGWVAVKLKGKDLVVKV